MIREHEAKQINRQNLSGHTRAIPRTKYLLSKRKVLVSRALIKTTITREAKRELLDN